MARPPPCSEGKGAAAGRARGGPRRGWARGRRGSAEEKQSRVGVLGWQRGKGVWMKHRGALAFSPLRMGHGEAVACHPAPAGSCGSTQWCAGGKSVV